MKRQKTPSKAEEDAADGDLIDKADDDEFENDDEVLSSDDEPHLYLLR